MFWKNPKSECHARHPAEINPRELFEKGESSNVRIPVWAEASGGRSFDI
jgi:hypothetical protein